MPDAPPVTSPWDSGDEHTPRAPGPGGRMRLLVIVLLALTLFGPTTLVGLRNLNGPPLPAERGGLLENPLVTRQAYDEVLSGVVSGRTYPPAALVTYLLEARGGATLAGFRRTDVLLHVANAFVLWLLAYHLLSAGVDGLERTTRVILAWCVAALWAALPLLAVTYAAELGRPRLLGALFAMLSALLLLLGTRFHKPWLQAGSVAALVIALLSQPVALWPWALFMLAAAQRPPSRLASRLYGVLSVVAIGVFAYALTHALRAEPRLLYVMLRTTWLALRDAVYPDAIAPWYLPSANAWVGVGAGLLLAVASLVALVISMRQPRRGVYAAGIAWFWAALVSSAVLDAQRGLATDEHLYLAIAGPVLIVAVLIARWLRRMRPEARQPALLAVGLVAVLLIGAMWWRSADLVADMRDPGRRFAGLVTRSPGDPRAYERLAVAQAYASQAYSADRETRELAAIYAESALVHARRAAELVATHRGDDAGILLRVAEVARQLGRQDVAAELATQAADSTSDRQILTGAAQILAAVDAPRAAAEVYRRLLEMLPQEGARRAVRELELADLLLLALHQPAMARPHYRSALLNPDLPAEARDMAQLNLALAEIRAGLGETGYTLLVDLLARHPNLLEGHLALAEYHLRSHHWPDAEAAYDVALDADPANYTALRGYYEVAAQTGAWQAAMQRFQTAASAAPRSRALASFLAWTATCAEAAIAEDLIEEIRRVEPDNRFACLSNALRATRDGDLEAALDWVATAAGGAPIEDANALRRAAAAFRLLRERAQLPPRAAIVEAALWRAAGDPDRAVAALEMFPADEAARWEAMIRCVLPEPDEAD